LFAHLHALTTPSSDPGMGVGRPDAVRLFQAGRFPKSRKSTFGFAKAYGSPAIGWHDIKRREAGGLPCFVLVHALELV